MEPDKWAGAGILVFSALISTAYGIRLGLELYGMGALIAIIAGVFDCMDGMLARELNEISLAGGLLDSSLDRYVEFALMGGLAIAYRHSALVLAITLLAILGSFMVSYSTAKADQYQFTPPRGAMRRSERMVYLLLGTTISAILGTHHAYQQFPVVASLTVIAIFGNYAAIIRIGALRQELRTRARKT